METGIILQPAGMSHKQVMDLVQARELPIYTGKIIESVMCCEPSQSLPAIASKLNDIEIARAGGGTQLSKLKLLIGEKNNNILISSLIYDLLDYYNVKNGFSDSQVKMLVELIISDFWHLKIEQITRAFHLQKTGKLVKVFERLDPSVIIELLNLYEKNIVGNFFETDAVRYKEGYDHKRNSTNFDADAENFRSASIHYIQNNNPKNAQGTIKPKPNKNK